MDMYLLFFAGWILVVGFFPNGSFSTDIIELVSSLAAHEDSRLPEGLECCVVQVRAYSARKSRLDDTLGALLQVLESSYPVTITRHWRYVAMMFRRDASFVLLDATGFGSKFPAERTLKRLEMHNCYLKSAKFVVLVDMRTNLTDSANFLATLGIVNYLIVPVQLGRRSAELLVGPLYTRNQYSGREYLFDIRNHSSSSLARYFPEKLGNVHGYHFEMFGLYEFPYLIELQRHGRTAGLLLEFMRHLIVHKLNGTYHMSRIDAPLPNPDEIDLTFDYTSFRPQFMHDITLQERSGPCLLCPFSTERDFMSHLLKPFSPGIWVVLGAALTCCRLLEWLWPTSFRGDLFGMVFFGSGVPHRQPFPTRTVTFGVALLVFFLSEAYNAKIISLMALAKYYERPETVQELNRSMLKIANPGVRSVLLAQQLPGKVISGERARQLYEERGDGMFAEYCTMVPCHMAQLYASDWEGTRGFQQYVLREQVMEKLLTIQLAANSPFHRLFAEYLLRFYENGLWMHRLEGLRNKLSIMIETVVAQFSRVVFHFEDLFCIWVLIVVGWMLSVVCFLAELMVAPLLRRARGGRERFRKSISICTCTSLGCK